MLPQVNARFQLLVGVHPLDVVCSGNRVLSHHATDVQFGSKVGTVNCQRVTHRVSSFPVFIRVIHFKCPTVDEPTFFDAELLVWVRESARARPLLKHFYVRSAGSA